MMWQFILIGDVVAMGFLILLVILMGFIGDKEAQDYCMKIPLEDS